MKKPHRPSKTSASTSKNPTRNSWKWVFVILILLTVCIWCVKDSPLSVRRSEQQARSTTAVSGANVASSKSKVVPPSRGIPGAPTHPEFDHTFDTVTVNGARRSLLSTGKDRKFLADTDVNSGR